MKVLQLLPSLDYNTAASQVRSLAPLLRLRRLLHDFHPDRIHVWRAAALRPFALVGRRYLPRVVVSQLLPTNTARPRFGKFDRWLLQRVDKVIAESAAEADRLKHLG